MSGSKDSKRSFVVAAGSTDEEKARRREFFELFRSSPIPDDEMLGNLGLFIKRQELSRILFMHEMYRRVIDVHGVVMEFGVRWGQNLALMASFRGIYEPYNYNRKLVGFDTFAGFPSVHSKDGRHSAIAEGAYAVPDGYEEYLDRVLAFHEQESPIAQKKKYDIRKGDACEEIVRYLEEHPETIVALAYFDFDLYEPTKKCLEAIKPHLTKGSVVGFDELNTEVFPGETLALREVFGLDRYRITRSPLSPLQSYVVIE